MKPFEVMVEAFGMHLPVKAYALFSGGNDSMVSTHFSMEYAHEVLHIDTGTGLKETQEFVRETCRRFGWPLRIVTPPAKSYRQFVLEKGFPGPAAHRYCYSWLKERAIRKVVREAKTNFKDRVLLITGVRNQESARRMGFVSPIVREGARVWVAPIYAFSKLDMAKYRADHQLPVSPVSENLGFSGECLCGAFASPGELERIRLYYPYKADEIEALQEEVKMAGKHHEWGKRPPRNSANLDLFMPMCVGCNESKIRESR